MYAADENGLLNEVVQMTNKKLLRKYALNNFPLPNTIIHKIRFHPPNPQNPRLRQSPQILYQFA